MSFALVVSLSFVLSFFVILDLVVVIILGRRGQGERERREEPGGGRLGQDTQNDNTNDKGFGGDKKCLQNDKKKDTPT